METDMAGMTEPAAASPDGEVGATVETTNEQYVDQPLEGAEESAASEQDGTQESKQETKKRIEQLLSERHEASARAEAEARRAQAMQQELAKMQGQNWQQQHAARKPNFEDYATTQEFEQAYGQWVAHGYQVAAQQQQRAQYMAQQQQQAIAHQASVQSKVQKAAESIPDFNEVVNNPNIPPLVQINQAAYQALTESDEMGGVAYYLAKHPGELNSFRTMTPVQAIRKITQLEAKVKAGSRQPEPTEDPEPPPTTVKGKSGAKRYGPHGPENMKDWIAWYDRKVGLRK
jgi:hypothetical protein